MEAIAETQRTPFNRSSECACARVHPRAGSLCQGCRASETGSNCWEMSVSPCCDLARSSCSTCTVYAMACRALSLIENVDIDLEGDILVQGEVYVQRNRRLSDTLNDADKPYIVVSNAVVTYPGTSGRPPEQRDVIMVLKSATRMIYLTKPQPQAA